MPPEAADLIGCVQLVGAGPGPADLLTVRAMRAIQGAEALLYDALISDEVLALAPSACVKILTGKRGGRRSMAQSTINRLMMRLARRGLRVVRLKGGDPSIFGRVSEERDFLIAHGVASEIVPGVTAASAAAAQFGFSLTHRDQARRVVLTTARTGDGATAEDWRCAADPEATVAVYMGGTRASDLAMRLMQAGRSPATPAIAIESAEGPGARMLFKGVLRELVDAEVAGDGGPVLIVVGEVTRRASALTGEVAPPELLRAAI